MADRLKLLIQKRTSLKSQITALTNSTEKGKLDKSTLKLRIDRLTELFHAYEEYHNEIVILEPNVGHGTEFANIQDRFYDLAVKIKNIVNPIETETASNSVAGIGTQTNNATVVTSTKKRRIKLSEAPMPTFDGKYENWLSFKNTFHSIIGSQTDLSDIEKLHYLKAALVDDAANKIKIFTLDGINYAKAWELLERAYEVKRILITRHLSLILNLPVLDKESTSVLSKLAGDAQQHLASLNALDVTVGPEMIIYILESKLPKITLEKWETSLDRDEFPTLDQLYEFLYKTAVCASKRERSRAIESGNCRGEPEIKRKRYVANKAFIVNTSRNCPLCKTKQHPLYRCDKFKQLSIPKRIEAVKNAKICYNCLRSHRDRPCKFSTCTICNKRHNTLLHLEGYKSSGKVDAMETEITKS